ncbi:hypothetical protein ACA910_011522 [Epithemia clementina (nom. ined.)]
MAEGGQFPWKRQKASTVAPDYRRLLRPLPEPPQGLKWVLCHTTSSGDDSHDGAHSQGGEGGRLRRQWMLVDTTGDVNAVAENDMSAHFTTTTTTTTEGFTCGGRATAAAATATICVAIGDSHVGSGNPAYRGISVPIMATAAVVDAPTNATETVAEVVGEIGDIRDQRIIPHATMVEPSNVSIVPFAAAATGPQNEVIVTTTRTSDSCDKKDSIASVKMNEDNIMSREFTEHVILPTDTLLGICLKYHISKRELQRANGFYGDNLRLAPERLVIPITEKAKRLGWQPQEPNSKPFQMAAIMARFKNLSTIEAKCYLETNDWNLEEATQEALKDEAWEREEHKRTRRLEEEEAARRRRAESESRQQQRQQQGRRQQHTFPHSHPHQDIYHSPEIEDDALNGKTCLCGLLSALRALIFGAAVSPRHKFVSVEMHHSVAVVA